ncbi:MAG TPA: M28 family peptidase [Caldithrix abyssi]|uniref:Carboxypeptidase Q n=1 Tax=Caldithrix abyssi TaxID=187145 RepID=A0A7V5H5R5_CALAY|nr:M28 family peptidase [Caldisericaceae bacterium]HHE56000.1 M28 family peptidase [Caldithrix abyssi]
MKLMKSFLLLVLVGSVLIAGDWHKETWNAFCGSAFVDNASYRVLQRICDEAGGRLVGSLQNEKALAILIEELQKLGIKPKKESFTMPGWVRGNDEVVLIEPTERKFKAIALGYVDRTPTFSASLVNGHAGQKEMLDSINIKGKIVLITAEKPKRGKRPLRSEVIRFAAAREAKAVLFVNNKVGGLVLAGTSSFQGEPAPIPGFSITLEEGKWLERLLAEGKNVRLRIKTESFCKQVNTSNVVVTLGGKVKEKIVLGAHFDSWDLGQGSIDNGIGSAILFEVVRLFKQIHPENYFTLEFVWFNGEELGLWGSKKYMEAHGEEPIVAMINMDMTGRPTGFNAMGFDGFVPFLEGLKNQLIGFDLERGVINRPWTNSDHMPFMMKGIPNFSLTAHLDKEQVSYYHSLGDTFDKVRADYLSQAAAIVSILTLELSNRPDLPYKRLSKEQTAQMLKKYHLDDILKREKEWSFK